jgi:hypothetical protein
MDWMGERWALMSLAMVSERREGLLSPKTGWSTG